MCNLAVTCHLHFWQNDRDLLRATAVTRGWNGYRNKNQHKKVDPGEETSPAAPAGTRTWDLSITSPTLWPLSYPRSPVFTGMFLRLQLTARNKFSMISFYLILFSFISFIYLNLLHLIDSPITSPYILSVNLYFCIKAKHTRTLSVWAYILLYVKKSVACL